jgi:EpsI family protein
MGSLGDKSAKPLEYFVAYYISGNGELISSSNRLYHQDNWTIVSLNMEPVSAKEGSFDVTFEEISDSVGNLRLLAYWYVVDGQVFANQRAAKLQQIANVILGKSEGVRDVIRSQVITSDADKQKKQFMQK